MLNYGFSTYALHTAELNEPLTPLPVQLGMQETVALTLPEEGRQTLVKKAQVSSLTQEVSLPETVHAPVVQGQQLGTLTVRDGETMVLEVPIQASETVEKLTWWEMYRRMLGMLCLRG